MIQCELAQTHRQLGRINEAEQADRLAQELALQSSCSF
ncbi:hypothetical protein NIES2104_09560 [Leptolyngbya sp. NIES-2104]|nr:hypothetical protein NIES2104_09560 [Leptolyngbya sp. NIES-2104]